MNYCIHYLTYLSIIQSVLQHEKLLWFLGTQLWIWALDCSSLFQFTFLYLSRYVAVDGIFSYISTVIQDPIRSPKYLYSIIIFFSWLSLVSIVLHSPIQLTHSRLQQAEKLLNLKCPLAGVSSLSPPSRGLWVSRAGCRRRWRPSSPPSSKGWPSACCRLLP